jgi:hypothetical protein
MGDTGAARTHRAALGGAPSPASSQDQVTGIAYPDSEERCERSDDVTLQDLLLLCVGIAPTAPPRNGKSSSTQTLRSRIQYHLRGNAEGSSLRLPLGCLLAPQLGLQLRRVGSGTRLTFAAGEGLLSNWLELNARVAWLEHDEPWKLESTLIQTLSLPLNLDQNEAHPFFPKLSALRAQARARARTLPILEG